MFGAISGGHFNPVVSLLDAALRGITRRDALAYIPAQIAGSITGAIVANTMFALAAVSISTHHRASPAHLLAEVIATVGLLMVIFALARSGRATAAPAAVGAYIGAAYWFTSSTSFANPAITAGRAFSDTFAGIAPASVPGFVIAQLFAALVAFRLIRVLYPDIGPSQAAEVIVPHDERASQPSASIKHCPDRVRCPCGGRAVRNLRRLRRRWGFWGRASRTPATPALRSSALLRIEVSRRSSSLGAGHEECPRNRSKSRCKRARGVRSTHGLRHETNPRFNPRADDRRAPTGDHVAMTTTDYLINAVFILIVFRQSRERELDRRSVDHPAGARRLRRPDVRPLDPDRRQRPRPDRRARHVGLALGVASGFATTSARARTGSPSHASGGSPGALLIAGIGSRMVFAFALSHGAHHAVASFSVAHQITAAAWPVALVLDGAARGRYPDRNRPAPRPACLRAMRPSAAARSVNPTLPLALPGPPRAGGSRSNVSACGDPIQHAPGQRAGRRRPGAARA